MSWSKEVCGKITGDLQEKWNLNNEMQGVPDYSRAKISLFLRKPLPNGNYLVCTLMNFQFAILEITLNSLNNALNLRIIVSHQTIKYSKCWLFIKQTRFTCVLLQSLLRIRQFTFYCNYSEHFCSQVSITDQLNKIDFKLRLYWIQESL